MLIDDFVPRPDYELVRSIVLEADQESTMAAVMAADLLRSPVARLLTAARDAPNRVLAGMRRQPAPGRRINFGNIGDEGHWHALGEVAGSEWVAGAIGKFWERDYGWVDFDPEAFVNFDTPGYAKTAVSFVATPYGPTRTLLVYESRTVATSDSACRRFGRYWRVLHRFIGVLMETALESIRHEVDRAATNPTVDLRDGTRRANLRSLKSDR